MVIGTRPEIVKMGSIISELEARNVEFSLIHTGQHYDWEMSQAFLEELGLGAPDTHLAMGSGSPRNRRRRPWLDWRRPS